MSYLQRQQNRPLGSVFSSCARQGSPCGAHRECRTFRPAPLRMLDALHAHTAELRAHQTLAEDKETSHLRNWSFCLAPGRARTCNLRIRSPTLYPIELRAHVFVFIKDIKKGWKTGLEPATTRSTIWGSTIELLPPLFY